MTENSQEISKNHYRTLLKQKEQEMIDISIQQIQELEIIVRNKDECIQKLENDIQRLQKDFKYNLEILQERDKELEGQDHSLNNYKKIIKEAEDKILSLYSQLQKEEGTSDHFQKQKEKEVQHLKDHMEAGSSSRCICTRCDVKVQKIVFCWKKNLPVWQLSYKRRKIN